MLERFALAEGARRGRQTFALRRVEASELVREEDVAAILELQGELEHLQGVLQGSALAIDYFQGQADDLNQSIQLQQQALAGLTQRQRELAISGDTSSTAYKNLNDDIIQANQVLNALRSEQQRYNAIIAIAESNIGATSLAVGLLTEAEKRQTEASESAATTISNRYVLSLAELKTSADETRVALREAFGSDLNQRLAEAITASDAYYNAQIENSRDALANEQENSQEYFEILANILNLERQQIAAREALLETSSEKESEAIQRLRDARISAAERARAVEVASFQLAAASGESYAEQLSRLATVSQRRAFDDLVQRFLDQGLSLEEARAAAEPYIAVIGAIPPALQGADAAYGEFSHTFQTNVDKRKSIIKAIH